MKLSKFIKWTGIVFFGIITLFFIILSLYTILLSTFNGAGLLNTLAMSIPISIVILIPFTITVNLLGSL